VVRSGARTIVVSPAVKAELEERFREQHDGRSPTATELGEALRRWEQDEALYREALREGLDRKDETIRKALADKVRERAVRAVAKREPTDEELARWQAGHRGQYQGGLRYDYVVVSFPRNDPDSPAEIEGVELALGNGADPKVLARPMATGNATAEELGQRFGAAMASTIRRMPLGRWRRVDGPNDLMLVRVNAVDGGQPRAEDARRRAMADWAAAEEEQAQDQAVQAILDRYDIVER
jgi:hypothetical protein